MKRRIARSFAAMLSILGLLIPPPGARACGPYFTEAIFIQVKHPDLPFERYASGELGIVRPSYARSYLVVAYRYWEGKGLGASEQKQAVAHWNHRLSSSWLDYQADGRPKPINAGQLWLEARKAEAGASELEEVRALRTATRDPEVYFSFENCSDNAFLTATAALRVRVKQFGARSEAVKEWLKAQDTVFRNCAGGNAPEKLQLPTEAADSLPAIIRADREYQRAAAYFYAMQWAEAERRFLKIAENRESPWRQTAAVVAVRCRIREATLDKGSRMEDLRAADTRLRALETEPEMRDMQRAIRKLRGFLEFRTNPEERRLELAKILASGSSPSTLSEDLDDYTRLLDGALGEDLESDAPPSLSEAVARRATLTSPEQHDDLTDWLLTFQAGDQASTAHAYSKWEATKATQWLVAAISKDQPNPKRRQELLEAAAGVAEKSPAYTTVGFYRARMLTLDGKVDEARDIVDRLLQAGPDALPISSRNFVLALRMKLARNFDEFLKFAPRQTAALTSDVDGYDLPEPAESCKYGGEAEIAKCRERLTPTVKFDSDTARIFTEKLPMEYWLKAAESSILPERQRQEIAAAAWVRAVLLDDDVHGKRASAILGRLAPELRGGLQKYDGASSADEKRFAAALLLLSQPEMVPEVRGGAGREAEPGKIDSYGNNWWCAQGGTLGAEEYSTRYYEFYDKWTPPLTEIYGEKDRRPGFVTDEEWSVAQSEMKKLAALGPAPNWLSLQAIAFAEAHPEDPRAPEGLHHAVRASRHGCGDDATGKYSKQAFQLLHQRYPKSEWAKKTPYWFN